jgi:phosphoribosylanthranilate isomerase
MPLRTKVKVGNISNLSDARYCAGMGVDMLSFRVSLVEGEGISPEKFKGITDWISGPEFVLEISEAVPNSLIEKYRSATIELDASNLDYLNLFKDEFQYIVVVDVLDWEIYCNELVKSKERIRYLLVTNQASIDHQQVRKLVVKMAADFSVLLSIDLQAELLDEYLSWPVEGFALNGSEEETPGIKDYDHLSSILEKLEVD